MPVRVKICRASDGLVPLVGEVLEDAASELFEVDVLDVPGYNAASTRLVYGFGPAVWVGVDEHARGAPAVDELGAAGCPEVVHLLLPAVALEGEVGLEEVAHELVNASEVLLEVGVGVDEAGHDDLVPGV